MLMHVQFEVFETVTTPDDVARIRQGFAEQVRKVLESGKVRASGIFTDARAGFFLMDVDSSRGALRPPHPRHDRQLQDGHAPRDAVR